MHWTKPLRVAVCRFLQRAAADGVTHFPLTCTALTLSSYCVAMATRENKASDHMGATVTTVTSDLCFDLDWASGCVQNAHVGGDRDTTLEVRISGNKRYF